MSALAEQARLALSKVFDPCSVIAATPLSIVDMGLVTRFEVTPAGEVSFALCPTSPACTLIARILEAAEEKLRAVPGVTGVVGTIDNAASWTEDSISESGRNALATRRARSLSEAPVKPRQWEAGRTASAAG